MGRNDLPNQYLLLRYCTNNAAQAFCWGIVPPVVPVRYCILLGPGTQSLSISSEVHCKALNTLMYWSFSFSSSICLLFLAMFSWILLLSCGQKGHVCSMSAFYALMETIPPIASQCWLFTLGLTAGERKSEMPKGTELLLSTCCFMPTCPSVCSLCLKDDLLTCLWLKQDKEEQKAFFQQHIVVTL